jgi:hypothetical protein
MQHDRGASHSPTPDWIDRLPDPFILTAPSRQDEKNMHARSIGGIASKGDAKKRATGCVDAFIRVSDSPSSKSNLGSVAADDALCCLHTLTGSNKLCLSK